MQNLASQLPAEYADFIDGLQHHHFLDHVGVSLAIPLTANGNFAKMLGNTSPTCLNEYHKESNRQYKLFGSYFPDKIDRVLWCQRYDTDSWSEVTLGFLCTLKDCEFTHGYFEACDGSCGYNNCEVGGSWGQLYIGSFQEVIDYGMSEKFRSLYLANS